MRTIFLSILAMLLMCGVASAAPPGPLTGGGGISKNVQAIPAAGFIAGTNFTNVQAMASLQTQVGAIEPKGLEVAAIGANPTKSAPAAIVQAVIANSAPGSDPGISRLFSEVALSGDCKALAGGTRFGHEDFFRMRQLEANQATEVAFNRIWPQLASETIAAIMPSYGASQASANCANA